jgi:hypothetical protein
MVMFRAFAVLNENTSGVWAESKVDLCKKAVLYAFSGIMLDIVNLGGKLKS